MAIGIIIGIVLVVLAIAAGAGSYFAFDNDKRGLGGVLIAMCILLVLSFIVIPFSFHTIESGQVGVVKQLGKVKKRFCLPLLKIQQINLLAE